MADTHKFDMPRKRKTKAVTGKPKPKLPDGDEGADLSQEERKAKLQVYLKEFDKKVEDQRNKMLKDMKYLLLFVSRAFAREILNLPESVKKMTLQEFIDCGGTTASVGATGTVSASVPVLDVDLSKTAISARVLSRINPNFTVCDTIMEEEQEPSKKSTRKNNSVLTSTTKNRKGARLNGSVNMGPPPAPSCSFKSSRYQTPLHGRSLATTGWDTPMITPKFDPRLPVTPAQKRDANPGEILLSMGGSPVHNPRDRGTKAQPVSLRGKTLTIDLEDIQDLENIEIPDSDEMEHLPFKAQVSKVMNVLSEFLKKQQNGN